MLMRRYGFAWNPALLFSLALVVGACFGGEFVQGLGCESDADCGPNLRCVEGVKGRGY